MVARSARKATGRCCSISFGASSVGKWKKERDKLVWLFHVALFRLHVKKKRIRFVQLSRSRYTTLLFESRVDRFVLSHPRSPSHLLRAR